MAYVWYNRSICTWISLETHYFIAGSMLQWNICIYDVLDLRFFRHLLDSLRATAYLRFTKRWRRILTIHVLTAFSRLSPYVYHRHEAWANLSNALFVAQLFSVIPNFWQYCIAMVSTDIARHLCGFRTEVVRRSYGGYMRLSCIFVAFMYQTCTTSDFDWDGTSNVKKKKKIARDRETSWLKHWHIARRPHGHGAVLRGIVARWLLESVPIYGHRAANLR